MISAEQARFATDFATALYEKRRAKPAATMLFVEECQEFIPQNPMKGEERMLHAFQRLVKIGRYYGVGACLVTQRPQEVAKKVLNMTECLFAFQMTGVHERRSIHDWIADKDARTWTLLTRSPNCKSGTRTFGARVGSR